MMKRVPFLIIFQAIIVAAFCLLIWIEGAEVQIHRWMPFKSVNTRLLIIAGIISAWLLARFVSYITARISEKKLAASILKFSTKKTEPNKMNEYNRSVRDLILNLKKSQTLSGKKIVSINRLPWYLVLGPKHSGKTALLENSGLHFPQIDHERIQLPDEQEIELSLYVSEEAVFIEYSRPILALDEQDKGIQNIWKIILKTLKKYKKGKAINGLIITIDIDSMTHDSKNVRKNKIDTLRSYIMDLYQFLGVQLPVYVFITKCDLLSGFLEYFGRCDLEEQNQIVGFTLPLDVFKEGRPAEILGIEYDQFLTRLNNQLLWLLESEQDLKRRESISLLPQQILLLKSLFVEGFIEIFQTSKLYELIQFRGVYFASSLSKNGMLCDPLNQLINKQFNLNLPVRSQRVTQSYPLFIKQVFNKVIFPEQNLVNYSDHVYRAKNLLRKLGYCAAVLFVGFGSFMLIEGYLYNKTHLQMMETVLKNSESFIPGEGDDLCAIVLKLDTLQSCLDIYNHSGRQWILSYELYRTVEIKRKIESVMNAILAESFLPKIAQEIELQLIAKEGEFESLYNILKAYLALGNPSEYPKEWIENIAGFLWQAKFAYNEEEQTKLNQYLHLALQASFKPLGVDQNLVLETIDNLLAKPLAARIYSSIREDFLNKNNHYTDLLDIANQSYEFFSGTSRPIPKLFTHTGFVELYSPALLSRVEAFRKDGILVKSMVKDTDHAISVVNLSEDITNFYMEDYLSYWQQAIDSLQIRKFSNYEDALSKISHLRGENSPVKKILDYFAQNTNLILKANKSIRISNSFNDLIRLANGETINTTVNVNNTLKNFDNLYALLMKLREEPDINKASFLATHDIMAKDVNPISEMLSYSNQLPKPLNIWQQSIATNTWALLMDMTHHYINNLWKKEVVVKFEHLKAACPFNEKSKDWVSMKDFSDLFSSDGAVENFYATYLKPYIDTSNTHWQWSTKYKSRMSDHRTAEYFEEFMKIKQAYFSNNNKKMEFDFTISPISLSPNAASVIFKVGDQQLIYRHGPIQEYRFTWPPLNQSSKIMVIFRDFNNQTFTQSFDGPWSLFKLMNSAKLESSSGSEHYKIAISAGDFNVHFSIKKINGHFLFHSNSFKFTHVPDHL